MERNPNENWHIIGTIPENIAKQIGMGATTPVWISDKAIQHITKHHGSEFQKKNTTVPAFVHKVVTGFDNVYRQSDGTLLLAIEATKTAMVTYIKLELATENYWRVKSAHIRKLSELNKFPNIWTKKKTVIRK